MRVTGCASSLEEQKWASGAHGKYSFRPRKESVGLGWVPLDHEAGGLRVLPEKDQVTGCGISRLGAKKVCWEGAAGWGHRKGPNRSPEPKDPQVCQGGG